MYNKDGNNTIKTVHQDHGSLISSNVPHYEGQCQVKADKTQVKTGMFELMTVRYQVSTATGGKSRQASYVSPKVLNTGFQVKLKPVMSRIITSQVMFQV